MALGRRGVAGGSFLLPLPVAGGNLQRTALMASYDKAFESYKKALTTAASVAASLMLVRSVVNEVVPYEVREMLFSGFGYLRSHMSSQHTIIVEKKNDGFTNNHIYNAVRTYLATRINTDLQQRLRVSSMDENDKMMISMAEGEEMLDVYEGTEFKWCLICQDNSSDSSNGSGGPNEVSFEVSFHKNHKEKALKSYFPFILATAKDIKAQERTLRIYMTEYSSEWSPIDLHHPSTFDTLAMDRKLKQSIIDDLNRFIKRKDYYKKIGKAWKRGYLLYGPPGTGKSSLIAAMANHLRFDIYDLELTEVNSNSDLRRLLVGMSNRSILVVEDIDCTIDLKQREEGEGHDKSNSTEENKGEDKVTLSGLLNFVDGLWSTSGEERIIVFTTNYKERLDPALLRPGRMDMHIHMGYCTQESFRILANNYHSIDYHDTYPEIEKLIKEVTVTPAEVAEVLMRNDDTDTALHDLVHYLPFIVATAKAMRQQERALQIHMNEGSDVWSPMDLHHPSTFDTIAMDLKLKQSIVDDLNRFVKRKDYYKRIGKAWKRGYLLYGPPGTGKSSLIAAMANHLRFDIYDLELTAVQSNSDLRMLLVGISSRSILVVEDIDCTIKLQQREGGEEDTNSDSFLLRSITSSLAVFGYAEENVDVQVTLSGLLNFVDGLWSAGGEERIIVFTTNYKERLDPALLRPGRMDMHIYMGYCTPESFRILAKNYHLIDYHAMYPEIEKLIGEVMVTPAEVAEVLMRNDDADVALHDLVDVLPHIVATAKAMKDQHRSLKMHMIEYDAWTAVDLRHLSTFDTLAMDKKLKQSALRATWDWQVKPDRRNGELPQV